MCTIDWTIDWKATAQNVFFFFCRCHHTVCLSLFSHDEETWLINTHTHTLVLCCVGQSTFSAQHTGIFNHGVGVVEAGVAGRWRF
jgi:hypothetical protein